MGNQLAGIAPSQILSVDSYFSDIHDYEYDKSLGSTRFFKVARAKHREGLLVVKVFAIQDPSLPLGSYKQELEELKIRLHACPNCLPFQRTALSEKAAILFRQYVRDNLYDRISTRPFLNNVEKRWLAFQILAAVEQAHKAGVRHGDIKTENVMVTSWNWVLLTDFASFKPTYLPEDNPADFNYFFDTSRRRTCYIAPERFVDGSMFASESDQSTPLVDLSSSNQRSRGELRQAMDIFSAGCVIAELFTEGVPLFDLSQLLAYRRGLFQTEQVLLKIEDRSVRDLVAQMVQREPEKRLTAEEHLKQQRGRAFPDIFYTFLQPYIAQFAKDTFQSADERVLVIRKDLDNILHNLRGGSAPSSGEDSAGAPSPREEQGLVVLVSVITSCLQTLRSCDSKLAALELVLHLAARLSVDMLLDRIAPYLLHFCSDSIAARARPGPCARWAKVLALVKEVPRNDVNIYPEYILPGIAHVFSHVPVVVVLLPWRPENIAHLAESALRFLELVQENNVSTEQDASGEDVEETLHPNENYDSELQALHELVQQKVVTLLSDPENIVKQSLMENGMTRLCVFFGRQKANDVLLSHMITFLNDKNDWHLRGAFFDSIVGVAAYVGWQSSAVLKPLLQQGLSDAEEFVICKALAALTCMCQLGLLQKPHVYEFVSDVAPFLCHPNLWIRYGAVGFVSAIGQHLNVADVYCKLMPHLHPFLSQPIIQIDQELVLLSVLKEPVSRSIFDYALRSRDIASLFRHLLLRQKKRMGSIPECPAPDDPAIAQMLKKLLSQGMTEAEEDKLLALKDFMLKSNKAKATMGEQSHLGEAVHAGAIDLSALGLSGRQADLVKPKPEAEDKRVRKSTKLDSAMNEEWKSMFGSQEPPVSHTSTVTAAPRLLWQPRLVSGTAAPAGVALDDPIVSDGPAPHIKKSAAAAPTLPSLAGGPAYQRRINTCRAELQQLLQQKREQCSAERMAKQMMESAEWESRPPPPGWHPKGLLVAHLHEHKAAVNRIRVSDEHAIFATASSDGTVKVWDSQKMEGKTTTTRSVLTYARVGGRVHTLAFCQGSHYLAAASDSGSLQVLAVEANKPPKSPKVQPFQSRCVWTCSQDGCAVDIHHFNSGAQSVLAYATVNGWLVGWDLRSGANAWTLRHDLRLGLITSFSVDVHQCWLCLGTSSGTMACWDMRFQLPISDHHPARARIRRLLMHPLYQSSVIAAAAHRNSSSSSWDMVTVYRKFTLWLSPAQLLLENNQPSPHSVHGLYCSPADGNPLLLTAGSDMRIRFWDLAYPERSYIVAGGANDSLHCPSVLYSRKIIEGTEVVQEIHSKQKSGAAEDSPRRGPDSLPVGHHDIITDVATFQTTQGFIVTASRDGIVKVWK
uniref:non-specific serine/threonine protein kinase n=1 Tax=Tetraodon nigroviridis TaxID=99883 RepID=H3CAL5_TETNG